MDSTTKGIIVSIAVLGVYWLWEKKKEDIPEIIKKMVYWVCYLAAVYSFGILVSVSPLSIWWFFVPLLFFWFVSCSVIFGRWWITKVDKNFLKEYYQSDGLWLMSLLVIAICFVVGYK